MNMSRESVFIWKVVFSGAAAIIAVGLLFFYFNDIVTWMTLNDPFQDRWAVVQLSNGGRSSTATWPAWAGAQDGLTDVYLLDKVAPAPPAAAAESVASSTDLSLTGGVVPAPAAQPTLIPVSDTPHLYISRAAVVYFKYARRRRPRAPVSPLIHRYGKKDRLFPRHRRIIGGGTIPSGARIQFLFHPFLHTR